MGGSSSNAWWDAPPPRPRRGSLHVLWKLRREARAQDQRIGQLLVNAMGEIGGGDPFYLEDAVLEGWLDEQRDKRQVDAALGAAIRFASWVARAWK